MDGALELDRRNSPRLRAYLALGAVGLFLAAAFGSVELVILVAPLLIAALAALAFVAPPRLAIEATVSGDRVVEGDSVQVRVRMTAEQPARWLEVGLVLPRGLIAPERRPIGNTQIGADLHAELVTTVVARRWGNQTIGPVVIRARDAFGFVAWEAVVDPALRVRVFPRPETLRRVIRPARTLASFGNETSRLSGDGIEFSSVRPYTPGDNVRRVNWRVSARRPELHVNDLHPETTTQVVLLLDTFTDLSDAGEQSSLAMGVRAVNGIADHYLRRRDRVGLVTFGASIQWLTPAMGERQSYRILDLLLDATARPSAVWKGVDLVPPRSLPSNALVIALSPLVDRRAIDAIFNLRARGFDLAVIELFPDVAAQARDAIGTTAGRLWALEREMLRDRFRAVGVPVATWTFERPLALAIEEIRRYRRTGSVAA